MIIETEGLTKYYGAKRGIEDLTLGLQAGEVFGYLGPNGAGKTTTIRLLLDLIRPTRGAARIFGLDCRQHAVAIKERLGYLPGELRLYEDLTGEEFLQYAASLRPAFDQGYVRALAERLDIDLHPRIKTFSHGTKQKLGLIQALMHRPELVILDEPTTGLDPLVQQEFYRLVLETKAEGRTVFLSSHILPEVERVCDRVAFVRSGRLVDVAAIADLKQKELHRIDVQFGERVSPDTLDGIPGVRTVTIQDSAVTCEVQGTMAPVLQALARLPVLSLRSHDLSLEEVFLAYYQEKPDAK